MEKMYEWVRGPNDDDVQRISILDSYRMYTAPTTSKLFEDLETDIVTVPVDCASLVKPMDTHVNKVFKESLRCS